MIELACVLIIGWVLIRLFGFILDLILSGATYLVSPKISKRDERDLLLETLIMKKLGDESHSWNR